MPRKSSKTLTPEDWIKAAFRNLAVHGEPSLKAEVLARQLGTTKGSFYWHFKDVPAFKREMLRLWEAEATSNIMHTVMASPAQGTGRLRMLAQIVSRMNAANDYGGLLAEPGIREWARHDRQAANALRKVDHARIAFVAGLFSALGQDGNKSRAKAELFYGGFVGLQALAAISPLDVEKRMTELLERLLTD